MKITDTERLDWLDNFGDIGRIRIDPDLEGSLFITWNHWNKNLADRRELSNVREAIDRAIKEQQEIDKNMIEVLTEVGALV